MDRIYHMDKHFYVDNAKQCLGWADKAKDPEHRQAFIDLARTWLQALTRLKAPSTGRISTKIRTG